MASVPLISDDILSFVARTAVTDSQEIKWRSEILLAPRSRMMPFYDLMGGINSAKPFKEVVDFRATKGQEIVVTSDRPLGGSGTQGAATANRLLDNIEDNLHATFRAKVGLMAHAVGAEELVLTQTVIGTKWDERNKKKLKEWAANKKAEEIQWELMLRAHARNTIYAGNRGSRDTLTSADTLNLQTISSGKELLAANQAKPVAVGKSKAGAEILKYFFLSNQYALRGMTNSPAYLNLLANAGARGDGSYIFAGGQPDWDGSMIHNWNIEDGTQIGAKAAPVAPRQYLGVEFPANATASGELTSPQVYVEVSATNTTAPYFQYFPAAACVGHEGTKIAATTGTTYVVGIKVLTGSEAGKIALISYKVNDGNRLTTFERLGSAISNDVKTTLTGTSITYDAAGPWNADTVAVGALPVGSLIIPVNLKGQPYVKTFGLGQDSILSGYGSISHSGSETPGRVLVQMQDFDRLFAIGWEDVWGCRAMEDADGMVNGYVMIESAYNPDGWPTIV